MNLTAADRDTPLWRKLRDHLQERLNSHRLANDSGVLTDVETARLRGRIAEAKEFLNMLAAKAPSEDQTAQALGE